MVQMVSQGRQRAESDSGEKGGGTPQHYILFVYLTSAISNAYYYFAGLKE